MWRGKEYKFRFTPEKLREDPENLLALPRLSILGLMTIPPMREEASSLPEIFLFNSANCATGSKQSFMSILLSFRWE